MGLAKVHSCAIRGLDGSLVEVEVDVSNAGIPGFFIVGLPDATVQEAKERVRAAIRNSGALFPYKRVVVSLAPADVKKESSAYDLPMAVGVLLATGQVTAELDSTVLLGELGLDGVLRHTTGILPMVALAQACGIKQVYVPAADAGEAALVAGITVYPVPTLARLIHHLNSVGAAGSNGLAPEPYREQLFAADAPLGGLADLQEVRGQEHVKRALEVAAAGGHNMLMQGPPGSGKTLLARCLPSILPPMTRDEMLEVTKIYSVAGMLPAGQPLVRTRPFRAPHHTASHAALVGGGRQPRPGEITLAHRGVLFLDELLEFDGPALENLRQPLEDRVITITRVSGSLTFPASLTLIGACNPCPCGYYGDNQRACVCSASTVTRYKKRLSGPLLDRIDIHVEVPRVAYEKLAGVGTGEPSAAVRGRVEAARRVQQARLTGSGLLTNSEMRPAEIRQFCVLDTAGQALVKAAMRQLNLSARGYHRILKLARTIADLAGSANIEAVHLAEALQYRAREAV
ncbi:MAG: YifB family Mg chelatase-like AAA ATPase [Chloroflexota bacterium]|nr:YifB family Mg chelatase-like AAA ATPase [Chloroflexota bacterium]